MRAGIQKSSYDRRKMILWRPDTQHNDIQHNDTQHNDTQYYGASYDTQHKGHSA
jgi:hypothetical protein